MNLKIPQITFTRRLYYSIIAVVFSLGFLLYANSIRNGFVLDDAAAVQGNKLVQKGISAIPQLMKTSFFYGHLDRNEGTYRPASLISFAIEKEIFGNNPYGYHFINVLLFALTVSLLFTLLVKLLGKENLLAAFVITLIYTFHPIHTEVVANIKSRDEIYCFLFGLLAMHFAINYKNILYILLAGLCFFLALLSKESALPFLLIIPLTLYYFSKDEWKKFIPVSGVLALVTIVYLGLRYILFSSVTGITVKVSRIDNIIFNAPFTQKFATAVSVIGKYLWLLIKPYPLSFDYSYHQIPLVGLSSPAFLFSLLIILALFGFSVYTFRKKSLTGFAILFFFISLSVVANIFIQIGSAMAERFLYIPSLGFAIVLGLGITYVIGLVKNSVNLGFKNPVMWLLLSPVLLCYGFITIQRNADWKDKLTLYKKDVKATPNSARVHYSLGTALYDEAMITKDKTQRMACLDEAEGALIDALNIEPKYAEAIYELGLVYHEKGDYEKERSLLKSLSNVRSDDGKLAYTQANSFMEQGRMQEAIAKYRECIKTKPGFVAAYINLGSVYNQLKRYDSSIFYLQKAINITDTLPEAYINIGMAYAETGNRKEALKNYIKANELKPTYAGFTNLANALTDAGSYADAEKYYLKAAALEPSRTEALFQLSLLKFKQKKIVDALPIIEKIVKIDPNNDQAITNLGYCKMNMSNGNPALIREALSYFKKGFMINHNNQVARNSIVNCFLKLKMKDSAIYYSKIYK